MNIDLLLGALGELLRTTFFLLVIVHVYHVQLFMVILSLFLHHLPTDLN